MLNELTLNAQGELTMSSKEIAELIVKQHVYVLRYCDKLNEKYGKSHLPKIEERLTERGSEEDRVYYLTYKQTLDLLKTGYRSELCIKVISKWIELEDKNKEKERELRVTEPTEAEKEALKVRLKEAEARLREAKKSTIDMISDPILKERLMIKFFP